MSVSFPSSPHKSIKIKTKCGGGGVGFLRECRLREGWEGWGVWRRSRWVRGDTDPESNSPALPAHSLTVRSLPPLAPPAEVCVVRPAGQLASRPPPQASSCSGKLRILRWACLRYCCCLKYTLNAPFMATKAIPPCRETNRVCWKRA